MPRLDKSRLWWCLFSLGCSRSPLLAGEIDRALADPNSASGAAAQGMAGASAAGSTTAIGFAPPTHASRRWLVVPTNTKDDAAQLFGVRFGAESIEDVVRLDPGGSQQKYAAGDFSPSGRGYSISVASSGGDYHGIRLVDFDEPRPEFIELPQLPGGRLSHFGPWLDDHRVIVIEGSGSFENGQNCRIVDLDLPEASIPLGDFGTSTSSCPGQFGVSPKRHWLHGTLRDSQGTLSLWMAEVSPVGLGSWTRVLEFPEEQGPARFNFSGDEGYLVLEKVNIPTSGLLPEVAIVRLSDPPVELPPFALPPGDRLNYVKLATSGSRFFLHGLRILDENRGTNPITVVDAESGEQQLVTPKYFASSSPGLVGNGMSLLTYPYSDETGDYGMQWVDVTQLTSSASLQPLVSSKGLSIRGGHWTAEGDAWFGICGSVSRDSSNSIGPIDLERFDFDLGYPKATHRMRLSEDANVDKTLFSPDASALVFRVVVTSELYDTSAPITQGHYTSELGTYVASTAGGTPTRLRMIWTAFDHLTWLPDMRGLLRLGPKGAAAIVADAHDESGNSAELYVDAESMDLHWLRFDGGEGTITELNGYFGSEYRPNALQNLDLPSRWGAD